MITKSKFSISNTFSRELKQQINHRNKFISTNIINSIIKIEINSNNTNNNIMIKINKKHMSLNSNTKSNSNTNKSQKTNTNTNPKKKSLNFNQNLNQNQNQNPNKIQSQKFSKLIEEENVKNARINKEKEIEKAKIKEENKEFNITRRNNIKREKEKNLLNKVESNKFIEEVYSQQEFENLFMDVKNNEIILYRMTSFHRNDTKEKLKNLNLALPACFFGGFIIDLIFPAVKKGFLINFVYYNCLFFDYGLFIHLIYKLFYFKSRTISAKYIHKDKIVEFCYFNYFGYEKFIKENLLDLKRITTNDEILSKINSKKNNNLYRFYRDIHEINYIKLINYIFPKAEIKKRKEPSMVDSLWEKN
jgi:hypothetical protein